jgi:hypothetical protein
MTNTTQFRALTTPSGKKAVEAWTAVWQDFNDEIALCAPTLEALQRKWKDFCPNLELNPAWVQHVYIVSADSEAKNAPDVAPASAKVACQFCGRQASFIIRKIAVCERRECKEKVS